MNFVNQCTIDGVTYTAYRQVDQGVVVEWITAIESLQSAHKTAKVRIKDVWGDPAKLKALFEGAK